MPRLLPAAARTTGRKRASDSGGRTMSFCSMLQDMTEDEKREVTLAISSYQPTKAELEEPITFPEGTTAEDLAKALMSPVEIRWKSRPECPARG